MPTPSQKGGASQRMNNINLNVASRMDPVSRLVEKGNTDCICIVSQYHLLSEQVGAPLLWLPPQFTQQIGRDAVTKVTDMACSTVQVGLTHFTMGCKAALGSPCSCFVLLDNVGEGLCIARSRAMDVGQYEYLKHGEYFLLGKTEAFMVTIISNPELLVATRKQLRGELESIKLKRNWLRRHDIMQG